MARPRKLLSKSGGTRAWAKMVADYVAVHQICWLRLPGCTIRSQTIDHYWPMKYRPDLVGAESNWRPACHRCNRARRATLPSDIPKLRAKMEAAAGRRSTQSRALGFFS